MNFQFQFNPLWIAIAYCTSSNTINSKHTKIQQQQHKKEEEDSNEKQH